MTKWGGKLVGVDEGQLRQQLRMESDNKAVKRLTSAVLYKQGKSPNEIERLLSFPEQTVYEWIDTVAERDPRPRSAGAIHQHQFVPCSDPPIARRLGDTDGFSGLSGRITSINILDETQTADEAILVYRLFKFLHG